MTSTTKEIIQLEKNLVLIKFVNYLLVHTTLDAGDLIAYLEGFNNLKSDKNIQGNE